MQSDINIPNSDLVFFKESYVSETRSVIPTWASKVATLKGASLGFFFHETFNDFNDATDVIKEQQLNYLNLKMKVQKSGNKPKQFMIESLQEGTKPVELRYATFDWGDIACYAVGCVFSALFERIILVRYSKAKKLF